MIMVISVPPICNKAFFTQGLNVSNWINPSVLSRWHHRTQGIYLLFHVLFWISFIRQLANTAAQLTTLSTMNFILKRADRNIEYLMEKSESHSSQGYTADLIGELMQQYRETLSKVSSVYSEKQKVPLNLLNLFLTCFFSDFAWFDEYNCKVAVN